MSIGALGGPRTSVSRVRRPHHHKRNLHRLEQATIIEKALDWLPATNQNATGRGMDASRGDETRQFPKVAIAFGPHRRGHRMRRRELLLILAGTSAPPPVARRGSGTVNRVLASLLPNSLRRLSRPSTRACVTRASSKERMSRSITAGQVGTPTDCRRSRPGWPARPRRHCDLRWVGPSAGSLHRDPNDPDCRLIFKQRCQKFLPPRRQPDRLRHPDRCLESEATAIAARSGSRRGTIGVLANPTTSETPDNVKALEKAAKSLGVRIMTVEARSAADFEAAFGRMAQQQAQALLVMADPSLFSNIARSLH